MANIQKMGVIKHLLNDYEYVSGEKFVMKIYKMGEND